VEVTRTSLQSLRNDTFDVLYYVRSATDHCALRTADACPYILFDTDVMENYHANAYSATFVKSGLQNFSWPLSYWLNICGHFDIPAKNNTSDFLIADYVVPVYHNAGR
jgi:hypothetical protein